MGEPHADHNEVMSELIRIMWKRAGTVSRLNVMAESLLLGVAMLNFPAEPRKQALIIQEIADGAADRAKAFRPIKDPPHAD